MHLRQVLEEAGRIQHHIQVVGHAVRTRVGDHILLCKVVRMAILYSPAGGVEHRRIGAVGDQLHAPPAVRFHMPDICRAVDDHPVRGAIEEALQPLGETDEHRALEHPHRDGELRPEIAHFEEKFSPFEPGQCPGRDALKDGRGCSPDQVHLPHAEADPERGEHE